MIAPSGRHRLRSIALGCLGVAATEVLLNQMWTHSPQGLGNPTPIRLPPSSTDAQLQHDAKCAQLWRRFCTRSSVAGYRSRLSTRSSLRCRVRPAPCCRAAPPCTCLPGEAWWRVDQRATSINQTRCVRRHFGDVTCAQLGYEHKPLVVTDVC